MRIVLVRSWVMALAFGVTLSGTALAQDAGDYAPGNIEHTYSHLKWLCMLRAICPVSDNALAIIQGARAGNRSAEYLLGLTLLLGDDLPTDRKAGVIWIARAAELGEPAAARDIQERLRNGEAIDVDETKVANALKQQADAGDPDSMRTLGPMYIAGRGVARDTAAGLDLMQRAAAKGSTGAELDLSDLYLNGAPGIPKNRLEAIRWLGASAGHGNIKAMVNLGYMAVNGSAGAPADLVLGYCWLMRAALVDQPDAQEKLTTLFSEGAKDDHGAVIEPDLVQADVWFRVASRNPYHDNQQIRAHIEPQMTTGQLDQAKHLAEAWQPRGVEEARTLTIQLPPPAHGNCPPMR